MKSPTQTIAPVSFLILAMISVQLGAAFSKNIFGIVGAEGATALRFCISALILSAVFKPWQLSITAKNWKALSIYSVSMYGTCFFFYMSLQTLPLGIASTIEFCGPIAVAAYSSRRKLDYLWIGLAVLGLILLMPFSKAGAGLDPLSVFYALLAGAFWGVYIIAGQKAGSEQGMKTVALGVCIASLIALPIGFAKAGTALIDPTILAYGLAIAIFTSTIPFTLEMLSLQRLSALAFGTLLSLEPAIATLVGFAFLGEKLALIQVFAIALIVAASTGISLSTRPRQS